MGAISLREIIAAEIRSAGRANSYNKAVFILGAIKREGHVILSPDEVRGIRDEALEEAAVAAERTYAKDPFRFALNTAAAAAIRSMKGGRDAQ